MAGSYPDVPATRIPYDIDGSQIFLFDGTTITQITGLTNIQDENSGTGTSGGGADLAIAYQVLIFPKLMDIDGFYCQMTRDNFTTFWPSAVATSADTTSGIDGTWTSRTNGSGSTGASAAEKARNNIQSATWPGTKAVRFNGFGGTLGGNRICTLHLYGEPSSYVGADRLEMWHPTSDIRLTGAYFDWGNVPRGSTEDRTFRVKNISPTYTANSINIAFDALTDASPTVPGQYLVSQGGAFAAQQTLTSIAPGALSPVLTVRRITPTNAQLGPWTLRVKATATSWT